VEVYGRLVEEGTTVCRPASAIPIGLEHGEAARSSDIIAKHLQLAR
jgi:hypothetical protein